jgi:hypothetical protein
LKLLKQNISKLLNGLSRGLMTCYDLRKHPDEVVIVKDHVSYSPDSFKIKKDSEPYTHFELPSIKLDPLFYKQIEKALLIGNGIILNERGEIILESTIFQKEYLFKLGQNHLVFSRFFQKKIIQEKLILSLSNVLEDNYYHWILESVTRVLLIENVIDLQNLIIVINDSKYSYKVESLTFLFKIHHSIIKTKSAKEVYEGSVLIPSFTHTRNAGTAMTDICHPSIIRDLNKKIKDRLISSSNSSFPLKFILSRKSAHGRKIRN